MIPLFLEQIETYLALEPAARAKPTPLFFIFHLLGEWREKAAYWPLARLLRLPGPEIDTLFGDGITTTSHRVMAAVFDGDPQPLYDIILDPNAEEFIRAGMCEALAMIARRTRSGSGRPLPPRRLYGITAATAELRLGRLAECHCDAWHERPTNFGEESFRRGSLTATFLDTTISSRISDGVWSTLTNPGVPMIATARYSAIPSKSYPDGTALPSNTAMTRSDGGDRQTLIMPVANALRIRSDRSDCRKKGAQPISSPIGATDSNHVGHHPAG